MNKANEVNLLLCKFYSSKKENQEKLVKNIFEYIHVNDATISNIIDCLEGKEFKHKECNIGKGDKFFIDLNVYSHYPSICKEYYEKNNLLINDSHIEVECSRFNILNNTIYFKGFKNLTIECEFEVDPRYIIKKSDLNIM